jgi:hypothetical protein
VAEQEETNLTPMLKAFKLIRICLNQNNAKTAIKENYVKLAGLVLIQTLLTLPLPVNYQVVYLFKSLLLRYPAEPDYIGTPSSKELTAYPGKFTLLGFTISPHA